MESKTITDIAKDLKNNSCVIVGNKGCGKSNLAKHLAREFLKFENTTTQIFDSSTSWFNDFDTIPFQFCADFVEFDSVINANMLYSIEFDDIDDINFIIREIIRDNYLDRRIRKIHNGMREKWARDKGITFTVEDSRDYYIAIIEEAQNVIGSYALMRRNGKKWLKMISDCRNFDFSLIFIGQRLADISAKATERCNAYFFGKMLGDNDILKVKRILGKGTETDAIVKQIKQLEVGQFIFWNGEQTFLVTTPKFEPNGTPKLWNKQHITNVIELFKNSELPKEVSNAVTSWIKACQK